MRQKCKKYKVLEDERGRLALMKLSVGWQGDVMINTIHMTATCSLSSQVFELQLCLAKVLLDENNRKPLKLV